MKIPFQWLTRALLATLFLFSVQAPAVADDRTINRLLASQCAQCHGTNGYARGDFDSLAGEEVKDMYEDLTDMKEEDQPENIMDHQALGYTNYQIQRIARFYAGKPEDPPQEVEEENEVEDEEEIEEDEEDEEDEEEDED
jgi:sulfide dehydrogenase cytochrome subunit